MKGDVIWVHVMQICGHGKVVWYFCGVCKRKTGRVHKRETL